jgi:hypothetical protein
VPSNCGEKKHARGGMVAVVHMHTSSDCYRCSFQRLLSLQFTF